MFLFYTHPNPFSFALYRLIYRKKDPAKKSAKRLNLNARLGLYSELDIENPDIKDYSKYIENQIRWYDNQSNKSKRHTKLWRTIIITITALITILNTIGATSQNDSLKVYIQIATAAFSALALAVASLLQLTQSHENWILFGSTAERLKKEYQLFKLKVGDYISDTANAKSVNDLFVKNTEDIISHQGSEFFRNMQSGGEIERRSGTAGDPNQRKINGYTST